MLFVFSSHINVIRCSIVPFQYPYFVDHTFISNKLEPIFNSFLCPSKLYEMKLLYKILVFWGITKHRSNRGFVHGSSMVPPWFVHRFRGFRWRNHGQTMKKPWRKYVENNVLIFSKFAFAW